MKTKNILKKELRLVESLIKKDFVKEKTISDLYDHVFKSKGKKIRAKLNLISSSQNKKINKNHRIKLAAIIELLHTATLVHDDVVDNSPIRRGICHMHGKAYVNEKVVMEAELMAKIAKNDK